MSTVKHFRRLIISVSYLLN